jgi:regulator of ribonuclease activity A
MSFATADLYDEYAEKLQSCESPLRIYGGKPRFFGRIVTVKCHEDNALLKSILGESGDGQVLVIDGGASLRTALVGDVIAELARGNGWSGLIVNGAIRDVQAIGRLDLGLKALGSNPRKSTKTGAGQKNVPVTFGNVTFQPDHWVYCDEDGLVVAETRLLH